MSPNPLSTPPNNLGILKFVVEMTKLIETFRLYGLYSDFSVGTYNITDDAEYYQSSVV